MKKVNDLKGKFKWIDIDDIEIDPTIQREQLDKQKINKIAKNFSWFKFGAITVAHRVTTGRNFVPDGWNRVLAALKAGNKKVPCIVFESTGRKCEADGFIGINQERTSVDQYDTWKTALVAAHEPYIEINTWLQEHGFQIARRATKNTHINFPSTLLRCWKMCSTASQKALLAQLLFLEENQKQETRLFSVLHHIERAGLQDINAPLFKKRIASKSRSQLMGAIRDYCLDKGTTKIGAKAQGLLKFLRKKK